MNLSKEPYKGTRDFYPEDMFVQQHIKDTMRRAAHKFGYEEYDASLLEETALYAAKTGEEIVGQQTYSFTDRGGREVTIRPEMTPTFARMIARRVRDLPYPARWFSIPNLFRYERPQRGRLREHWQLNVDVAGVAGIEGDLEIISVAMQIMKEFGATPDMYTVHINNRRLINGIMTDVLNVDESQAHALSKLIDRKAKITPEEFKNEASNIAPDVVSQFLEIIDASDFDTLVSVLPEDFVAENEGVKELQQIFELLPKSGIDNARFDIKIMRGFDYYTGTVFEVFDTHPDNNRSMFGGGRYDDLVSIFGVDQIPAMGFGMGDVTIRDFLEVHDLLPEYTPATSVYIAVLDQELYGHALELGTYLREQGVNVAIEQSARKMTKQLNNVDKLGIPFVLYVGSDEVSSGNYTVKNMNSGDQVKLTKEEIASFVCPTQE